MWGMLQHPNPDDFVVASGKAHKLEEFVDAAFSEVGLNWRDHVDHDPSLHRPTDIAVSVGNAGKARRELSWEPKVDFQSIVSRMMAAECADAVSGQ
jgi:GDPmannose 4,6-dehydratase